MAGRPMTRQSHAILAELNTTPEWWEGALDRLACGDSPKEVADEYCVLFGVFMRWIETDEKRKREYDAALRIAAEGHAHDCLAIADEQKEAVKANGETYDPDVARDKLRIETRLKLAGKWDRQRYGETVKHEHSNTLTLNADAALVGFAGELLSRIKSNRVIDVSREPDVPPALSHAVESPTLHAAGLDSGTAPPPGSLLPEPVPAAPIRVEAPL